MSRHPDHTDIHQEKEGKKHSRLKVRVNTFEKMQSAYNSPNDE